MVELSSSTSLPVDSAIQTGLTLGEFIEHSPLAVVHLDDAGRIIEFNRAFSILTRDHMKKNVPMRFLDVLIEEDRPRFAEALEVCFKDHMKQEPVSFTLQVEGMEPVVVLTYITLIPTPGSQNPMLVLHLIDQTEQKNLELRFTHSQKMQAVGQLAGGVAHDFNNLLTAMIGFCDLLLMRHPAGDPSFADIMQIKQNANRAANLVRQLLAFSRRQTLQPKTIDLTDVLAELSNLIRRLIGENIELEMVHGREIGKVRADQGQLEQVIINLAVNARDAMAEGGTLSICTRDVTIRPGEVLPSTMISPVEEESIIPGNYVLVEIADTGHGIPRDIVEKIFEPFYSTKEVGSGTGLGLATVYGIIKQTGGYIYVSSEPGKGTTFFLYFRCDETGGTKQDDAAVEETRVVDLTGKATILLVEDETPVRTFAARALGNKGYTILEAESGEHAMEVFAQHEGEVDLIISDVVMPGINGPKMVRQLEQAFPERMKGVDVIFISGYAEDAFVDSFGPEGEFNFLPKPFTLKQLASKVKEVTKTAAKA